MLRCGVFNLPGIHGAGPGQYRESGYRTGQCRPDPVLRVGRLCGAFGGFLFYCPDRPLGPVLFYRLLWRNTGGGCLGLSVETAQQRGRSGGLCAHAQDLADVPAHIRAVVCVYGCDNFKGFRFRGPPDHLAGHTAAGSAYRQLYSHFQTSFSWESTAFIFCLLASDGFTRGSLGSPEGMPIMFMAAFTGPGLVSTKMTLKRSRYL